MAPRVRSDLLLVGSLPATTPAEAMYWGGQLFGDLVPALPDGETGERQQWVGYEARQLITPHPKIDFDKRSTSPSGIPFHMFDTNTFQLRSGVTEIEFNHWSRITEAIDSYHIFCSLREQGVIPPEARFQVSLPFPSSVFSMWFRKDFSAEYPILERAYEELVRREVERLTQAIPPDDLALQWDVCIEVLDLEGMFSWTDQEGAWERYAGPARRLSQLVPESVLLGYHLCYGTWTGWPMYEAADLRLLVHMANTAVQSSGRQVDWLHIAGPRYLRSEDDRFFRPLKDLDAPDSRVYLGIILPIDGADGVRRRATTAGRYLQDFGVAMYCGFGRQPGEDGLATVREHRTAVEAWLAGRS